MVNYNNNKNYQLAQNVVRELKEQGLRVAFAESCTGGMASAAITAVEGVSDVLDISITAYANWANIEYTDVTEEVLAAHGAVSQQTASLMAQGIRKRADIGNANVIGVGITGIAGPGGGTSAKPVGTVYIAVDSVTRHTVKRFAFAQDRESVRTQTTHQSLIMLIDFLKETDYDISVQ